MTDIQKRELSVALLAGLIAIIAPFASDSYVPALPAITKALGSSANQMQLTMSLYFLGASFAQLIYGPLSDRFGRRIMVLIGFGICIAGGFLCAAAVTGPILIIARFLQGVGAGACNCLFRAIMRDKFSGSRLAQIGSYIGIVYPVMYSMAPILGGYIQHYYGWRETFMVSSVIILIAMLIIWRYLPETNLHLDKTATQIKVIAKNYCSILIHAKFVGYTLLSSIAFSGFICYFTVAPFLLEDVIKMSAVEFGWLSILLSLAILISQFSNSRLVMQKGPRVLIGYGVIFMVIGGLSMLMFALFHMINTWVIVIPAFIFSLASGFVFANSMAMAFECFSRMAGTAGAMYGFIQMMGSVLTSAWLAELSEKTQMPLAMILTGLGLISWIIFYLLGRYENSSDRLQRPSGTNNP